MIRKIGWQLAEHDFLNQITKSKGFSGLMLETNSWKREWAELINLSAAKLEKLVRLTRSYLELTEQTKDINVAADFWEAVSLYPEMEKKIKFSAHCKGITVKAHQSVLAHIFYNLIHNSEKYAGRRLTEIKINCLRAEDKTLLIYQDNGMGITKENKEKIFIEGYSEGTSAGLGLFLIQKFCSFYGWEITETGTPGKGVKFVIAIPN